MDQNTLTVIAAVTGLVSAVAGAFAAVAAFLSAGTAKDAAKHAERVERRGLLRDVLSVAQNVVAETMRVDDLANQLKQEYRTLATFSGQTGGSRPQLFIADVESKQQGIIPLQQEAMKIADKKESLRVSTEEELTNLLTKLDGYLVQTRRVKEKFAHDLESVQRDNQIYREKAIKGT